MGQEDRVKLLFGPDQTPKCQTGGTLHCRIRKRVKVAALTDAPILWPYTFKPGGARPLLILSRCQIRRLQHELAGQSSLFTHIGGN
jgi:hypothetical protein